MNVSAMNLFWHAHETWNALFRNESPFYDDPKTDETQTKQFYGMIRLLGDAIEPEVEVTEPKFVSFNETNPEHGATEMDFYDFDEYVDTYWSTERNCYVLRSDPHWDANATVEWNEFQKRMDNWDYYPDSDCPDERAGYEAHLNRFIADNC